MLSTVRTIATAINATINASANIVCKTANLAEQAIDGAENEVKALRIERAAELSKEFARIISENPDFQKDYQAFKEFTL